MNEPRSARAQIGMENHLLMGSGTIRAEPPPFPSRKLQMPNDVNDVAASGEEERTRL